MDVKNALWKARTFILLWQLSIFFINYPFKDKTIL